MNTDTPLIEYLIVGAHTLTWMVLIIFRVFNFPISFLLSIDPALLVFGLPFVYLIGMLFDDIVHRPLDPLRRQIRDRIYDPKICKDELLAYASENLYGAYEARVRRIRVLGAAIFNWPLLGGAILLHISPTERSQIIAVVSFTVVLSISSYLAWHNLYRRAYEFRRKAFDIIIEHEKQARITNAKSNRSRNT